VCEQVVREEHGLRVLEVRAARHDGGAVRVGLRGERVDQVHELLADDGRVFLEVEPHERRDLVVAAAAGAELAPELGSDDADEGRLERAVHVLVGLGRDDLARRDPRVEGVEAGEHRAQLVVAQVARRGERAGVRAEPARSYGASCQSKCVDFESRASSGDGPLAKRAPQSAPSFVPCSAVLPSGPLAPPVPGASVITRPSGRAATRAAPSGRAGGSPPRPR
jgi:hypothetical protein